MFTPFPFEKTSRPWFGPKKRARSFLRRRTTVLSPSRACQAIAGLVGDLVGGIQRVRFIDFCHKDEQYFRYTIALVWTDSDAVLRDRIYDIAAETVELTGWYPLPQGERLGSRLADQEFDRSGLRAAAESTPFGLSGPLTSLVSAVNQDGGCSLRCQTGTGSILLDTGLPGKLSIMAGDRLVLLTHSHMDHCGNLHETFEAGMPVVLSRTTARLLSALGRVSSVQLRNHCYTLDPEEQVTLGQGLTVRAFSVPHCPGATGFTLNDGSVTLVYPGDAVFRTARHDATATLRREIGSARSVQRVCLIDATMIGRGLGAGGNDAAAEVLAALESCNDIVLVSSDVEQLLYAYLDLYHTTKQGPSRNTVEFAVSAALKPVFEVLHSNFIARNLNQADPLLIAQYGSSMSAWAEARWLFWLRKGYRLSTRPGFRRIWLVSADDLHSVSPTDKAGVVAIGRAVDLALAPPFPWQAIDVDASAWTLHSREDIVAEVVRDLHSEARILLFHNYPRRMRKFVEVAGGYCEILGNDPISLSP